MRYFSSPSHTRRRNFPLTIHKDEDTKKLQDLISHTSGMVEKSIKMISFASIIPLI
jgi:hypothetical protein